MAETMEAGQLTMTRTFGVPPERVFDAWVDPEQRMKWWSAQEGMYCDACEIDARPGGGYRINMKPADASHEYVVVGEFLEFDRPRRLVMTWSWEEGCGDPSEPGSFARDTRLTLDFKPVGGGTELTLTHVGFTDQPQRDNHLEGWTGCLSALGALFDEGGASS